MPCSLHVHIVCFYAYISKIKDATCLYTLEPKPKLETKLSKLKKLIETFNKRRARNWNRNPFLNPCKNQFPKYKILCKMNNEHRTEVEWYIKIREGNERSSKIISTIQWIKQKQPGTGYFFSQLPLGNFSAQNRVQLLVNC